MSGDHQKACSKKVVVRAFKVLWGSRGFLGGYFLVCQCLSPNSCNGVHMVCMWCNNNLYAISETRALWYWGHHCCLTVFRRLF